MPPKNAGPSKKTEQKAKAKIIEDKTFGLKNKNKSAKVNQYIKTLEAQVKNMGNTKKAKQDEAEAKAKKEKKAAEEAKKAELAALFKPAVQQQKVPFGVDPKTVLCVYFKSGQCLKGEKCKFSHDPAVERKVTKISLYHDPREDGSGDIEVFVDDDMVVEPQPSSALKPSDRVCIHFIEAVEQKKYGWFWQCPNGDGCKYRHALPMGFVLKTKEAPKEKEDKEEISLEEFLETERHRIAKGTPVTAETFQKWKADRKAKAEAEEAKKAKSREAEIKAGRFSQMSGRDLFTYQPDLFLGGDDDEAMEADFTTRASDHEDEANGQVDASLFLDESLENLEIED